MLCRLTVCVALTLLLAAAPAAVADEGQTFNGNNLNGPRWNRPIGSGPAISAANPRYHVQPFRLESAATCNIYSVQDYDGYLHLYRGSFNPNNQLTNLVAGDDDGPGPLGAGTSQLIGLALTAGNHFLVTSAFGANGEGRFQNTIHCDGIVQPLHGACGAYFVGVPREQQVCLNGLFPVTITWQTSVSSGRATPVRAGSSDTALFWFFNDRNWEVMVKVLNGCPLNNHWWVFIGALTNQGYTVSVGHSDTLAVNTYTNPLGTRSPAFTDTEAFPCN